MAHVPQATRMKLRERLRAGPALALASLDTGATPLREQAKGELKEDIKQRERKLTETVTAAIARQQEMFYAQHDMKLLIVLQGMDTSGKDGTVRSLCSGINPMGLRAVQFKRPHEEEMDHDYLWRVHRRVPKRGEIALFNRSHYEDVLVPPVLGLIDEKIWQRRLAHIADFERMLAESGTVIVKLFLHISKDEQRKRLQARLDDPEKHWKFDEQDLAQRKLWSAFQNAYERAIRATDTDHAPWYVIPADSKTHRNLLVASLVLEIMESLKLRYPAPNAHIGKLTVE